MCICFGPSVKKSRSRNFEDDDVSTKFFKEIKAIVTNIVREITSGLVVDMLARAKQRTNQVV